jgi:DNA-binding response OmpR family regulator
MRILAIEDDAEIVGLLQRSLAPHGYQLISADTGEQGILMANDEAVDLLLLDISLPGIDGYQVLKRIRAMRPELRVLALTGRRDLQDKVKALNAGADDYLTKPFALEELLARMQALMRRADQSRSTQIESGGLRIDLRSRRAWREDTPVDLPSREFALLEYFMRHPRQVLTRQQILAAVWDYAFDPGSNVVEVYVRRLRYKLDRPGEPSLITTIRNMGYRFDPPPAS